MKDRFDLENDITRLFTFLDDIQLVIDNSTDNEENINCLIGIKSLLNLHLEKLMDTFSQCYKVDKYNKFDFGPCDD
jgi:hypothetical protein